MIAVSERRGETRPTGPARDRIVGPDGLAVVACVDEPLISGSITEVATVPRTIEAVVRASPDLVMLHRGPLEAGLWRRTHRIPLLLHLTARSDILAPSWRADAPACGVDDADRLGADAVSTCITADPEPARTRANLASFARLARECELRHLPLVALLNGRHVGRDSGRQLAYAARAVGDLGAEAVRVCYTGGRAWFGQLVSACGAAVLVGLAAHDAQTVLEVAGCAMAAGASGAMVSSVAFEQNDPVSLIGALAAIVHQRRSPREVCETYLTSAAAGHKGTFPGRGPIERP